MSKIAQVELTGSQAIRDVDHHLKKWARAKRNKWDNRVRYWRDRVNKTIKKIERSMKIRLAEMPWMAYDKPPEEFSADIARAGSIVTFREWREKYLMYTLALDIANQVISGKITPQRGHVLLSNPDELAAVGAGEAMKQQETYKFLEDYTGRLLRNWQLFHDPHFPRREKHEQKKSDKVLSVTEYLDEELDAIDKTLRMAAAKRIIGHLDNDKAMLFAEIPKGNPPEVFRIVLKKNGKEIVSLSPLWARFRQVFDNASSIVPSWLEETRPKLNLVVQAGKFQTKAQIDAAKIAAEEAEDIADTSVQQINIPIEQLVQIAANQPDERSFFARYQLPLAVGGIVVVGALLWYTTHMKEEVP